MAKILWMSNSPRAATGYGNQTGLFTPMLKKAGHSVTIFAFYGQEGAPSMDANGILNLPRITHPYGNDAAKAYYEQTQSELMITLINPWVLEAAQYEAMNWIAWTPIEGEPIQPADVAVLKHAKRIWAMSRHGEKQLRAAGFTNVDYVPHGVDGEVFKPVDRQEARIKFSQVINTNLDGRFLIVYNAANKGLPGRKGWYECMEAVRRLRDRNPDCKPLLYIHTERDGRMGMPLRTVSDMCDLVEGVDIVYPPQLHYLSNMISPEYLNTMYNAADVYFHPSHGEGFGIPILEAQAAGCSVLVPASSAMEELCLVGRGINKGTAYLAMPGQLWRIPDIDEAVGHLEAMWRFDRLSPEGAEVWRQRGHEYAMREFGAEHVLREYMLPAIERALHQAELPAEELAEKREARKARREAVRGMALAPNGEALTPSNAALTPNPSPKGDGSEPHPQPLPVDGEGSEDRVIVPGAAMWDGEEWGVVDGD